VTFGTNAGAHAVRADDDDFQARSPDERLICKAQRLHALVLERDQYFRQAVMADSNMGVMLSLFLAELKAVPMTEATLALVNLIDGDEAMRVTESLIHAGLAVLTGGNPERRAVGLSPLGSARMRSFISDFPEF